MSQVDSKRVYILAIPHKLKLVSLHGFPIERFSRFSKKNKNKTTHKGIED